MGAVLLEHKKYLCQLFLLLHWDCLKLQRYVIHLLYGKVGHGIFDMQIQHEHVALVIMIQRERMIR